MIPLAERMRPRTLQHVMGQAQLTGPGKVLSDAIRTGYLPSIILWGPPGVGKTTIAHLIGHELARPVFTLSAISAGVREVREVIALAEKSRVDRGATLSYLSMRSTASTRASRMPCLAPLKKGWLRLLAPPLKIHPLKLTTPCLAGLRSMS